MDQLKALRDALTALLAAQATGAGKEGSEGGNYDELSYAIDRVKQLLVNKWVMVKLLGVDTAHMAESAPSAGPQDFTELMAEYGARISISSKAAIEAIIANLSAFLDTQKATDGTVTEEKIEEAHKQLVALVDDVFAESKIDTKPETKPIAKREDPTPELPTLSLFSEQLDSGMTFVENVAQVFAEAADSTPESPKYDMLLIKEGRSANKINYSANVLREGAPKFEGKPIYIDHPVGARDGNSERSLSAKVGWWTKPVFKEGVEVKTPDGVQKISGIFAEANLFSPENSPASWFPGMIKESIARGNPSAVGISIFAGGKSKVVRGPEGLYREALSIDVVASADAVAEPAAGGQAINFIASKGKDPELMELEGLTVEQLREARPDLIEALNAANGLNPDGTAKAPTPPATPPTPDLKPVASPETTALIESMQSQTTQFAEAFSNMQKMTTQGTLAALLSASRLPGKVKDRVRADVGDQIMAEAQISEIIKKYEDVAASILTDDDSPTKLRESHLIPFGGSGAEVGGTPLDRVMLSLDHFFGAEIPEDKKGKFPKIRSFAEAYRQITGDYEMTGWYNENLSALGGLWNTKFVEALPGATHVVGGGTITMANLLNTSMNKALFNFYQAQPRWWEPVVSKTELSNMKVQDRIRLANFGSLTERTVDGAEYTELDWAEVKETWTPTEYGNVVSIGRRAIINDDLRGIQNIPRLLAQSAITTINEYMANLFTQNSGNGPVLADGVQLFNAAGHQGNRLTAAFTRTSVLDARKVIQKMVNDAGKRIGLMPRILLVPVDLEPDAFELIRTMQVPESANNAVNILSDGSFGLRQMISVPQFTDAENWYLMADPGQLTSIELGFLYGREEPEMFTQDNPLIGMVFTNDVMTHKIRWDFGADWLDYRGAVASIPA